MWSRHDPRCQSKRFLELRRIQFKIAAILVNDAEPVAGKAAVSHDIAQQLIEGCGGLDAQAARERRVLHQALKAENGAQSAKHVRTERILERRGPNDATEIALGYTHLFRQFAA